MASRSKGGVKARKPLQPTPDRIEEAAMRLFAERGFQAVSLRDITGEADANIAAVNYHFGSKEGLIAAVLERHAAPVNRERLQRLDLLEREAGRTTVPLRDLLEAYVAPLFCRVHPDRESERLFLIFTGRMMADFGYALPDTVLPLFLEVAERFAAAFGRSQPDVRVAEIYWRLHFATGAVAHTLMHGPSLKQISAGFSDDPTPAEKLRRVVDFCTAGFAGGVVPPPAPVKRAIEKPKEGPREVQGEFF